MQPINHEVTSSGRQDSRLDRAAWVKIALLTNIMSIAAALMLALLVLRLYMR